MFSMSCLYQSMSNWLVVLTILKNNKSQWEGLSHILWKITYVPNHQPVMMLVEGHSFERMINGILPGTMINHQADLSHKRNRSKKYRKKHVWLRIAMNKLMSTVICRYESTIIDSYLRDSQGAGPKNICDLSYSNGSH